PGTPHEVLLLAIRENPELFAEVFRRVGGTDVPGPIEVIDSNVRFAASLETRPDLVLLTPNGTSKWTILELQNRKDESKCRSWPLAASVLLQREGMGPGATGACDLRRVGVLPWAWSEARRVATRAIELTQELPAPLREAQSHAILAMLS